MSTKPMKQRIDDDMKTAMKAGDARRLGVLRMVKARMQEAQVAMRAKKGRDHELDDAEVDGVLAACAKQRRDSIDSYRQAGRQDLVQAEEAELAILAEYLPEQLSEAEIAQIVREAIASTGAVSAKDMGAVMKIVMPQVKGKADGKLVNKIAAGLLSG